MLLANDGHILSLELFQIFPNLSFRYTLYLDVILPGIALMYQKIEGGNNQNLKNVAAVYFLTG